MSDQERKEAQRSIIISRAASVMSIIERDYITLAFAAYQEYCANATNPRLDNHAYLSYRNELDALDLALYSTLDAPVADKIREVAFDKIEQDAAKKYLVDG